MQGENLSHLGLGPGQSWNRKGGRVSVQMRITKPHLSGADPIAISQKSRQGVFSPT